MEDVIKKCSFENWYQILRGNTIRAHVIEMPDEFKNYLLHDDFIVDENQFPELEKKVNAAIEDLNGKAFPKLNFTAPTDALSFGYNHTLEIHSFHDLMHVLKASTRIMIDLSAPFDHNVDIKPYIVLKRYFNYLTDREFRIFMRDRDHYFVSSRNTFQPYHFDEDTVEDLADQMVEVVSEKLHPTKLIIDFYISPKMKPHIIDIAPWSEVCSPLLFEWDELEKLDECEVRLSNEVNIKPKEDPSVPAEMMDGQTLEQMIQAYKAYEEQMKKEAEEASKRENNQQNDQ